MVRQERGVVSSVPVRQTAARQDIVMVAQRQYATLLCRRLSSPGRAVVPATFLLTEPALPCYITGVYLRQVKGQMLKLTDKGRSIRDMFDKIAPRYDLLNRVLSLGIDRRWRRFAVRQLHVPKGGMVLDIATGTGDVALEIARQTDASVTIVGSDFTQGMLVLGRDKIAASPYCERILLVNAPCESMPHPEAQFDGITIAFGIRNVVDRQQGLREMARVLKPGGRVVILEFATPRNRIFRAVYYFYFLRVLPWLGGLISQRSAYRYLPDSVMQFPDRDTFKQMMQQAGFEDVKVFDLTGGIAAVHVGTRAL